MVKSNLIRVCLSDILDCDIKNLKKTKSLSEKFTHHDSIACRTCGSNNLKKIQVLYLLTVWLSHIILVYPCLQSCRHWFMHNSLKVPVQHFDWVEVLAGSSRHANSFFWGVALGIFAVSLSTTVSLELIFWNIHSWEDWRLSWMFSTLSVQNNILQIVLKWTYNPSCIHKLATVASLR